MMRDPHRPRIEVEPIVECGRLARTIFFADGSPAHGEAAAAWPRPRFEHAAVIANLSELIGGGQAGDAGAENQHAHAGDAARQLKAILLRGGE
jgi:hypothetical protein